MQRLYQKACSGRRQPLRYAPPPVDIYSIDKKELTPKGIVDLTIQYKGTIVDIEAAVVSEASCKLLLGVDWITKTMMGVVPTTEGWKVEPVDTNAVRCVRFKLYDPDERDRVANIIDLCRPRQATEIPKAVWGSVRVNTPDNCTRFLPIHPREGSKQEREWFTPSSLLEADNGELHISLLN